jgi:hypothetical protein
MKRTELSIDMKTTKKRGVRPKAADQPVLELSVNDAIRLMRTGIPLADLPRYRKTIMGVNESFWEHIEFLEGLGAARVTNGRLKQF